MNRPEVIVLNSASLDGKLAVSPDKLLLHGDERWAAIGRAADNAGYDLDVPFVPGRMDAAQEQTDVASFDVLKPTADGFRNYYGEGNYLSPANKLIDQASLLTLTVPEMTALIGGMRALDANAGGVDHGVFTDRPGELTNDFFVNLLDMSTEWGRSDSDEGLYDGRDRSSGDLRWTATPVDLLIGSHAELRGIAEVYASSDGADKFVNDFIAAWHKVMMLDRFDVDAERGGHMAANR